MARETLSDSEAFHLRFNPKDYLRTYYPPFSVDTDQFSQETLENIHILTFEAQVAQLLMGVYPAGNAEILDVGGGPTVYQHAANSLFGTITHAEFLAENRREVNCWLQSSPDAHDWECFIALTQKSLAQANNTGVLTGSVGEFTDYVRSRIKAVVPCDVFQPNLGISDLRPVDLVTSSFCVESATGDRKKWLMGMDHLMKAVKDGGYLLITAIRNADWYKVGDESLPAVSVNETDLKQLITSHGLA